MMRIYDSYKDSGIEWIGEIPSHWESSKMKYDVLLVMGQSPDSDNYIDYDNGIPFLQGNTEFGLNYPSNNKWTKQVTKMTTIGDLLYSVRGSLGEMNWSDKEYCIGRGLCSIRPIHIDRFYTFYLLLTLKEEIKSIGVGSTFLSISTDDIKNLFYFKPPISEQEQIVSYLDEKTSLIDEMVEKKKRKIELLKEYKTSLINTVVTKGLNPDVPMKDSGIEWIGEIPRHWECVKGSRLGMYSKGSGIKKDEVVETGIPCIRYGQIYTTYNHVVSEVFTFITLDTSKTSVRISNGTLLITGSGELKKDIGKCILYDGKEEIYVGGDIIILKPSSSYYPHYLTYLINSESIRIQKELLSKGEIIVHIYQKNFYDMRFPLPPLSEQEQIVSYLDEKTSEIDKTVELENKKIELLKEYRQSLISNVVTGKIKVVSE